MKRERERVRYSGFRGCARLWCLAEPKKESSKRSKMRALLKTEGQSPANTRTPPSSVNAADREGRKKSI